ncbi:hypothetical protein G3I60_28050 [Streptomyces sp. SID13666]|uniref:hypothetical protein n=1 Tax=unclassified Streptomyces TaxID=2593676 RepID=UPI0011062593|nr:MULTISPECIES: hypothetical protein [unclassified Streptomyces]MCZ4098369.1 hypothetical protein [Streptomyces sp. H39-C1]NEA57907.1 hypothetical protein [Streptomyces sp. SID13666]QNA75521.1 hypothetical protein C8250_029790 [Streptomyces sp. So13.3]
MDTTKTDALDKAVTDPETKDSTESTDSTATAADDRDAAVPAQGSTEPDARDEDGFDEDDLDDEPAGTQGATGVLAAAGSVVAVGLGISSLTGTWIGDLMKDREQLIGQIKTSGGSVHAQLAAGYGTPWHTVALFNGIFALVAILVAAVVLFRPGRPAAAGNHWSQALAWGGLILGVLGLLIAGVMWFDVFTDLPVVAATPQQ